MPTQSKGMREYQLIVNYFLRLDRLRGASYYQLAKTYKLDQSNIYKRINGNLNAKAKAANEQQPIAQRNENNQFCPIERRSDI
jgi:Mor family transcriptional regulator